MLDFLEFTSLFPWMQENCKIVFVLARSVQVMEGPGCFDGMLES
jgi:hypothetical protein